MQSDHEQARDPATSLARKSAAHWMSVLSDEQCTDAERRQFLVWLRASGQHVDEFLRLSRLNAHCNRRELWPNQSIAELIAAAKTSNESNVTTLERPVELGASRGERRPARWPLAAAAACLFAVIGLVVGYAQFDQWFPPEYVTTVGEQRSITLEDGSVVELNSQSRLRTHFTEQFRTVQLLEGEAIFRVAKNPQRPFRVRTGLATIEAVGTAFNVQARETRTVVTVLEGRVRVDQPRPADEDSRSGAATGMELNVGDQATLANSQPVQRISLLDTEKVTAWTDRRLIFEDTPLANAAAEFARYSSRTIRIDDSKIATRKITGVFDATDPASLVEFLSADESLDVHGDADGWAISAR